MRILQDVVGLFFLKIGAWLRSPIGAASMSFVVPGLGQATAGQPRRGAIIAIPAFALLGAVLLMLIFSRSSVYGLVVDQQWLTSLLILDLVAFFYHLWAIADAYLEAGRERTKEQRRRRARSSKWPAVVGVALILSGTVALHAGVASVDMEWQHTLYCLTAANPCPRPGGDVADTNPSDNPYAASFTDISSTDSSGSGASPSALSTYDIHDLQSFPTTTVSQNWAADGQLNVLLLGIGVGGDSACAKPNDDLPCRLGPDTLMVLHVDIGSGKAALISIGRNFLCVPLPQEIATHFPTGINGCPAYSYPYMINSLGTLAWSACGKLPYYQDTCGKDRDEGAYQRAMRAFETTLGTLLGMDGKPGDLGVIDGTVTINPVGLTTLIDDLGGVDVTVKTKLYDKPCGPAGTWQQKTGGSIGVPGTATCSDAHNGYSVPTGMAGVKNMERDKAQAGATIYWKSDRDIAFVMQAGTHHFDGDWALAFARTRMYTSDFDRAARQQQLLVALRSEFDPCTIAPRLPSLIGHISWAFHTNMPLNNGEDLKAWTNLAHNMLGSNVKNIVLNPRDADIAMPGVGGYPAVDPASWARIKYKVAHSLDGVPAATGSGGGGGGGIC